MRATSSGAPALAKRMHQRRLRRTKPRLVFSGWRWSRSIPGTLRSRPGTDFGVTSEVAMRPALPNEQASPGRSRSTSTTSKPRVCRRCAHAAPTMPAPMTTALPRFEGLLMERSDVPCCRSVRSSSVTFPCDAPLTNRSVAHCHAPVPLRAAPLLDATPAKCSAGVSRAPRRALLGVAPSAAEGRCCRGNSSTVCAARYEVIPVPMSRVGFTSTRSSPTTLQCSAIAARVSRSSA